MPLVSLVGYTNAGKSTLFNALTHSETYVAHQLFATLDPAMRKLECKGACPIILTDTVGFIQDLPHQLIKAFHATLEETKQATLLLHVIDISDTHWRESVKAVQEVLHDIGAEDIPIIQVFNKIDLGKHLSPKLDVTEEYSRVLGFCPSTFRIGVIKNKR